LIKSMQITKLRIVLIIAIAVLLVGCGAAKFTQIAQSHYTGPPISAIALSPGGGPFADAIGVELFNRGITIIDPERTAQIIGHAGLTEFQILSPESYDALQDAGIDALLVTKAVMAYDGTPESASVRITSTHTQEVIVGLSWQNGWGGQRGSIMDRTMRKNLAGAAAQIAEALAKRLRS
jgi:hypothetical protein